MLTDCPQVPANRMHSPISTSLSPASALARWVDLPTCLRWYKRVKANRPGAVLLDGGDLWQGSATSLWTNGQDMVDASKLLGIDVMTGHWEFTLGADRVQEIIENDLDGHIDFIAQNVKDFDFGDPVFASHTVKEINGRSSCHYWASVSIYAYC